MEQSKYDISLLILGLGFDLVYFLDPVDKTSSFLTLLFGSELYVREKACILELLLEKGYYINNDGSPLFEALAKCLTKSIGKYIELVTSQAQCTRSVAIRALESNDYDIVDAILDLTTGDRPDQNNCSSEADNEPIEPMIPLMDHLFYAGLDPNPNKVMWLENNLHWNYSRSARHCAYESSVLALIKLLYHKYLFLDFDILYELVDSLFSEELPGDCFSLDFMDCID